MMMLVGTSVVIAFVLQPPKEEPTASANSPVSHHRLVSTLIFQHFFCPPFVSSDLYLQIGSNQNIMTHLVRSWRLLYLKIDSMV